MARRQTKRVFDINKPVFARKFFTFNGRRVEADANWRWRQLAVTPRRVRQMFEAGSLYHQNEDQEAELDTPQTEEPTGEETNTEAEDDGLDKINKLKDLAAIAEVEGAPLERSRDGQRAAIRARRIANA